MGTESNTGFRNISVSNLVIIPSEVQDRVIYGRTFGVSGISLEMVDGGVLDGIIISNVRIEGTAAPVFIRLGKRNRPYKEGMVIEEVGSLRNVSISNLVATGAKKLGCSISGIPGHPVENIRLNNISISFEGGGSLEEFKREIPEKEKSYPEASMFGVLPSYGFFVRHAKDVQFSDIKLTTSKPDARPAVYLSDVSNSQFQSMELGSKGTHSCNIMVEDCRQIDISSNRISGQSSYFLLFKGERNEGIYLRNNLLTNIEELFTPKLDMEGVIFDIGNITQTHKAEN
jgi:hypothetical protein